MKTYTHWYLKQLQIKSRRNLQETPEGKFLEAPPEDADRRTEAEKRFDAQREKREAEQITKMTAKSHRQRIAEFNEHLGSLTEHMVRTIDKT